MKKTVLLTASLFLFSVTLSLWLIGLLELQLAYVSPYTDVDVATAYNMIMNGSYPNLIILDVRTQGEYDSGHIRGAVLIPNTELDARIGELAGYENLEIIVYCRSGARSMAASVILDSYNLTKVYNMVGGILAWQDAGYPLWIIENEKAAFWKHWRFLGNSSDRNNCVGWNSLLLEKEKATKTRYSFLRFRAARNTINFANS